MRIGISARISGPGLDATGGSLGQARHAREHGREFWTAQVFDVDALTALAVIGRSELAKPGSDELT